MTAAPGAEAAAKCFSENSDVDLLVTDVEMRGKTGIELAAELSKQQPGLQVLFVSGGGLPDKPPKRTSQLRILQKPFNSRALLTSVEQLLKTG